jgi:hypothetical protein
MNTAIPHPLTLNRVILHLSSPADQPQQTHWRWRITDALSRISLYPSLPPQAILIVRHLSDPLPGGLLSDSPWNNTRPWEQQAQAKIDDCWRTAIRAAHTTVPSSANAVWFADKAEWLACLSWVVHQGVATQQWWWQTWLRKSSLMSPSEVLFELWQTEVQWLPQTLTLLQQRHGCGLQPLLRRFSPNQARALRQWVTQTYALPALEGVQIVESLGPALPMSTKNLMPGLPVENQALVALGLGIVHCPTVVQRLSREGGQESGVRSRESEELPDSDASTVAIGEADDAVENGIPQEAETETLGKVNEDLGETDVPGAFGAILGSAEVAPHARIVSVQRTADEPEVTPQGSGDIHGADFLTETSLEESIDDTLFTEEPGSQAPQLPTLEGQAGQSPTESGNVGFDAGSVEEGHNSGTPEPAVSPTGSPPTIANKPSDSLILAAEQGIATNLGGLWYLVNVLADLDWLVDNTELNGWHKLLTLARALWPEVPPDKVWSILTELAAEDSSEAEQRTWLGPSWPMVEEYLTARLEPSEDLRAVMADILQEPATLYVTRTHIDVVFTLEQIRLDLRVAGLDRDPGWVPELARVIAFHYE